MLKTQYVNLDDANINDVSDEDGPARTGFDVLYRVTDYDTMEKGNLWNTPTYPCHVISKDYVSCGAFDEYSGGKLYGKNNEFFCLNVNDQLCINRDEEYAKRMIENYINHHMEKCVDVNSLSRRFKINKREDYSSVVVFVGALKSNIDDSEVKISLKFPYDIYVNENKVNIDLFSTTKDVKLPSMYELANHISRREIRKLSYSPLHNLDAGVKRDSEVEVIKNVNSDGDDVVRISNPNSKINDEPLYLDMMIQNRPPALDYIGPDEPVDENTITVPVFIDADKDGYVDDPNTFELLLKAIDPDEDLIVYSAHVEAVDAPFGINEMVSAIKPDSKGSIKFNVKESMVGKYKVRFISSDGFDEDYQDMYVAVDDIPSFDIETESGFFWNKNLWFSYYANSDGSRKDSAINNVVSDVILDYENFHPSSKMESVILKIPCVLNDGTRIDIKASATDPAPPAASSEYYKLWIPTIENKFAKTALTFKWEYACNSNTFVTIPSCDTSVCYAKFAVCDDSSINKITVRASVNDGISTGVSEIEIPIFRCLPCRPCCNDDGTYPSQNDPCIHNPQNSVMTGSSYYDTSAVTCSPGMVLEADLSDFSLVPIGETVFSVTDVGSNKINYEMDKVAFMGFGGILSFKDRFGSGKMPIQNYFSDSTNACKPSNLDYGSFSLGEMQVKYRDAGGTVRTQLLVPELLCPDKTKYDTSFCNPKSIKYSAGSTGKGSAPTISYQYCSGVCS